MKQITTIGTIIVLAIMVLATATNMNIGFTLMMSAGVDHNIARIVIIAALSIIVFTTRPRSKATRAVLAVLSAIITSYALAQTANYGLQIFDSLAYLLSAVILMTESLEVEPKKIVLSNSSSQYRTQ